MAYRPKDWNDEEPRPFYRVLKWFVEADDALRRSCAEAMKSHHEAHPRETKWANLVAMLDGSPLELDPDPASRYSIGEQSLQAKLWVGWVQENAPDEFLAKLRLHVELWHHETADVGYLRLASRFGWKGQWELPMKKEQRQYRIATLKAKIESQSPPPPPPEVGWTKDELSHLCIADMSLIHRMLVGDVETPPPVRPAVAEGKMPEPMTKEPACIGLPIDVGERIAPLLPYLAYGDVATAHPYPIPFWLPEVDGRIFRFKPAVLFVNSHGKSKMRRLGGKTIYITTCLNGQDESRAINDGEDNPNCVPLRGIECPTPSGFQIVTPPGGEGRFWVLTEEAALKVTVGFEGKKPIPEMTRYYGFHPDRGFTRISEKSYLDAAAKYNRDHDKVVKTPGQTLN